MGVIKDIEERLTTMDRRELRASDADRKVTVDRLTAALNEGRLGFHEYDDRLGQAYQAVTYGDLDQVAADLPVLTPAAVEKPVPQLSRIPLWVKILWIIWFSVVLLNLVVWALVSLSNGHTKAFWPIWVAGPWGSVLIGLTIAGYFMQKARQAALIRKANSPRKVKVKVKYKK
jgi:hypothetical protein